MSSTALVVSTPGEQLCLHLENSCVYTWRTVVSTPGEQLCLHLENSCEVCRDGVGTMISTDFYQGIRPAQQVDLDSIEGLLRPLAQAGVTKARSRESLMRDLHSFTVLERESEVLALIISHCTSGTHCHFLHALGCLAYKNCCQCMFIRRCSVQPVSMS